MSDSMELTHMLAKKKAQTMFIEMMNAAGVGAKRMGREVAFFMPPDFLDMYEELWYTGTAGKDGGGNGIGGVGAAQAEAGAVGKASVRNEWAGGDSNKRGSKSDGRGGRVDKGAKSFVGSGGAKRKSYKKFWVIADEDVLDIKDRVDKRLRAIVRDVRHELAELQALRRSEQRLGKDKARKWAEERARPGVEGTGGASMTRCAGCGRVMRADWDYCPYDAARVVRVAR